MRLGMSLGVVVLATAMLAGRGLRRAGRAERPAEYAWRISGRRCVAAGNGRRRARAAPGMELTVRLSFKRNGEIFGARITYQTR